MSIRRLTNICLLLILILSFSVSPTLAAPPQPDPTPPPPEGPPPDPVPVIVNDFDQQAADVSPSAPDAGAIGAAAVVPKAVRAWIDEVWAPGEDVWNPKVAYSTKSGQYLYVFQWTDEIWGGFWTADGKVGELFKIAEGEWADLAYDATNNRFLVVYETDGKIHGILVYGSYQSSGQQLPFAVATVIAASATAETQPAIAYNTQDHEFVVAYKHGAYGIYGRMVEAGALVPNPLGGAFKIRQYTTYIVNSPDVAWSPAAGTFLVVFEVAPPADVDYVGAVYLRDTYQNGGSQTYADNTAKIVAPYDRGADPLTKDCDQPSVAFDSRVNAYTIAFAHEDAGGINTRHSLHGQRLKGNYQEDNFLYQNSYAFPIETNANRNHFAPRLTSTGVQDEMYVMYVAMIPVNLMLHTYKYQVELRALQGQDVSKRLPLWTGIEEQDAHGPTLACHKGECLGIWQNEPAPPPGDLRLSLVALQSQLSSKVFIPIVNRH